MVDKTYWKDIVDKLISKSKANWAAHVLLSNVEIIDEIVDAVGRHKLIKNCLISYAVDSSVQSDMDEFLVNFSIPDLITVYKDLEKKPLEVAGALMWLLEDIDPEFKWANESK